ncbi:kinase-like protein, partial [Serendipita vermifera]
SFTQKLKRERAIWATLSHPNILPFWGFADGEDFGSYGAFISPWCSGGNSQTYLQDKGESLSSGERLRLFCGVVNGVVYLHSLSLIHADLKPANILIDSEDRPRLCDFGLARIFLREGHSGLTTTTQHTGTARYLAPELLDDKDGVPPIPTMESDIYALGCVGLKASFIFSRDPYHEIPNNLRGQIFNAIRMGNPSASSWIKQGDSEIQKTVMSCWNPDPLKRSSADNILSSLLERQDSRILGLSIPVPPKMEIPDMAMNIHAGPHSTMDSVVGHALPHRTSMAKL